MLIVKITAALRWASCGPGVRLQAHPLKSQYRFGKISPTKLRKSYKNIHAKPHLPHLDTLHCCYDHGTREFTLAGSTPFIRGQIQWKIPWSMATKFPSYGDNFLKTRKLVMWQRDLTIKMVARWIQIWNLVKIKWFSWHKHLQRLPKR